jgi:hypothetical protein
MQRYLLSDNVLATQIAAVEVAAILPSARLGRPDLSHGMRVARWRGVTLSPERQVALIASIS